MFNVIGLSENHLEYVPGYRNFVRVSSFASVSSFTTLVNRPHCSSLQEEVNPLTPRRTLVAPFTKISIPF